MENYLDSLNEMQKKAVLDTEGQLLVLAGAGSGKTRVLTSRIVHLASDCGVSSYNILAITFTNKAAAEMKQRVSAMLGASANCWISTFHSMCAQILFREGTLLGYDRNFSIYSETDSTRVVKRLLKEKENLGEKDASKCFDFVYAHIKNIKCHNYEIGFYVKSMPPRDDADLVLSIYNAYEKELRASNAMDFDDLLLNVIRLFEAFPDVLETYRKRFKYIHVDEFQDTSMVQYRLVRLLAGDNGNLFVVGDEDQSIYGWRGANIGNILHFKEDYPAAKVYRLEQNYRSTMPILEAANRVISNNKQRFGKKLFSEKRDGKKVEVFNAYSDRDEVDYIVRNISDLRYLTDMEYRDIAVLMRANSLSRQFEDAFNLYNIPYRVYGGLKFYERQEIKNLLAYIKIAINPKDSDSLARIINVPKRGIGDSTVSALFDAAAINGVGLYEVVSKPVDFGFSPAAGRKLAVFSNIWSEIILRSNTLDAAEFSSFVLQESGLFDFYKALDAEPERLENLKEFLTAVSEFKRDNPDKGIREFMQMVALISDMDEEDADNAVTLSTIHAVKGLEFRAVFIVALEENIFPSSRALSESEQNLEEERRLMYVAITRAKERLFCSCARSRFRFSQVQNNLRSRFLNEMSMIDGEQAAAAALKAQQERENRRAAEQSFLKKYTPAASEPAAKPLGAGRDDVEKFVVGTRVSHQKFGEGTVIAVSGAGNDKLASVEFKGLGVKKFVVAMSNMKIIG